MGRRELHHDQHMVSLLTDHKVFSPKYHGKILVDKTIALAVEGIIRKICKEMKIEIIDMAVNVDRVHLLEYPPKYSVSYIAKRMKGRSSRELREAFPHLKEWAGIGLWTPSCFHGSVGHGREVVERYIQNQEAPNAKSLCAGSVLKSGVW
jgi:putative transposase